MTDYAARVLVRIRAYARSLTHDRWPIRMIAGRTIERFHVTWYGGGPLLAQDRIDRLSEAFLERTVAAERPSLAHGRRESLLDGVPRGLAGHRRGDAHECVEAAAVQRLELVHRCPASADHVPLTREILDFLYSRESRMSISLS